MIARLGAAAVHLLTASGAVLALLALRAVHQGDWQMMFVWLGAALIVDAADGPLARKLEVKTVLPRFSGERLDLIVDYLTYVAVPGLRADRGAAAARSRAPACRRRDPVVEPVSCRRHGEQDGGGLFRRLPGDLEYRPALSVRARSTALRRACRRGVVRPRHLRAAAGGASVSRRAAAAAHLPHHPAMGWSRRPPPSPIPFHRRSGCKSCSSPRRFISRASASTARLPEAPHPLLTRQPDYQLNSAFNTAPRPSHAS